jgi:class 3 adenylate cyclase/YHS domain-containing protein
LSKQPADVGDQAARTFLFADVAGFTALTEAHGDEEAADLVDEFSTAARELVAQFDARLVKTIGDALMLCAPHASAAVGLGCALTGELLADHGYPAIRVGMHRGQAVERGGDFFGAAVNLAARISGLAAGGEVLLSAATRAAAGDLDGIRFVDRGAHRLRNVASPVRVFAAISERTSGRTLVLDPVCHMAIDPERAAGRLAYEGSDYYFCSLECASRFGAAPADYNRP